LGSSLRVFSSYGRNPGEPVSSEAHTRELSSSEAATASRWLAMRRMATGVKISNRIFEGAFVEVAAGCDHR
jgi:hypothetical protein